MSTGMLGFIGIGVESSGGASATGAYSAAVNNYVPFISETLTNNRNDIESQVIQAQFDTVRMYTGLQTIQGAITAEVNPIAAGFLMRPVFDQCTATQAHPLVASAGIVLSHTGVRGHLFTAGQTQFHAGSCSDLPTITVEVGRGPTTQSGTSFVYYNCAGNALELSIQAGQLASMTVDLVGREYGRKQASVPTFPAAEAFLWSQASVVIGGAARPIFESVTVRISNQLEATPLLDGRLRPNLIKRNGFRTVEVNGTMSFQTDSDYDMFIAGSETSLRMTFTGPQISAGVVNYAVFDIQMPAFRYTAHPINIGGPGRIGVPFQGRAMWHAGSGTAVTMVLVNTRTNPYTITT
jgi:hypothetical protein